MKSLVTVALDMGSFLSVDVRLWVSLRSGARLKPQSRPGSWDWAKQAEPRLLATCL